MARKSIFQELQDWIESIIRDAIRRRRRKRSIEDKIAATTASYRDRMTRVEETTGSIGRKKGFMQLKVTEAQRFARAADQAFRAIDARMGSLSETEREKLRPEWRAKLQAKARADKYFDDAVANLSAITNMQEALNFATMTTAVQQQTAAMSMEMDTATIEFSRLRRDAAHEGMVAMGVLGDDDLEDYTAEIHEEAFQSKGEADAIEQMYNILSEAYGRSVIAQAETPLDDAEMDALKSIYGDNVPDYATGGKKGDVQQTAA